MAMNAKDMTPFAANPFVFVFSGVLVMGMVIYFGWGALDRLALAEESASATVTGKHFNPPGVTYRTTIAGGRAWTLADTTSETYVLLLTVDTQANVGLVSKELYDGVQAGDKVRVRLHRTRFTKRTEVTAVSR
jgi:hypothetical protein